MRTDISPTDAQQMLEKDALNKFEGVMKRGRILTEKDRHQLRRLIKRARRKNRLPVVKKHQLAPPKLSTLEGRYLTRKRRRQVYLLRMQNYTVQEMADELHASKHTIIEDLKQIDDALKKEIDATQGAELLNEKLLELEGLKMMAIDGAVDSERGTEQVGYINVAVKVNELQCKLLQDAGVIRKVATKHELSGHEGKPFTVPSETSPVAPKLIINVTRGPDHEDIVKKFGKKPARFERQQVVGTT